MADGPAAPPESEGTQTAWGLLTSPRVFLGLTAVLGLLFAWAQTVPQRLAAGELSPLAPYAEAEALRSLGLDDVWVAWPVLLVGLLLTLVAAGLLLLRAQRLVNSPGGPFATAFTGTSAASLDTLRERIPSALGTARVAVRLGRDEVSARRGFEPEAIAVVVLGLAALVAGLFIGRANTFDARFTVVPGGAERADVAVRDDNIYLPSARALDLRCDRPDPLDPRRHLTCTLLTEASATPEPITLTPGVPVTTASGLTLTPLGDALRVSSQGFVMLLQRASGAEQLAIAAAAPTRLGATGDQLTAFPGPDGPLVVWKAASGEAILLAPPIAATPHAPDPAMHGQTLAYVTPSAWTVQAKASPASILFLLGVAFVALGLLGLALVPSITVTLVQTAKGTRVRIRSTNRAALAASARRVLLEVP